MVKERRNMLIEKYNRETIGFRTVVQEYMRIFKLENSVTDEEWDDMRRNPESGEIT
ncbi:MAG TPA: hypothetical protein VIK78_14625 [Ruminiclostridium sp.]